MTTQIIKDNDELFTYKIKNQNYVILSLRHDEKFQIDSFKVRGFFKTEDSAKEHINKLYNKRKAE